MRYGYACCLSDESDLTLQRRALKRVRCHQIFADRGSAAVRARLRLRQLLAACQEGDEIVVQRIECLARSPAHLVEILDNLMTRHIRVSSLTEAIDTTARQADLSALVGALAKFQRSHMAAGDRRRLRPTGAATARPRRVAIYRLKLSPEDIAFAQQLVASGETRVGVAAHLRVSPRTLYRALARLKAA